MRGWTRKGRKSSKLEKPSVVLMSIGDKGKKNSFSSTQPVASTWEEIQRDRHYRCADRRRELRSASSYSSSLSSLSLCLPLFFFLVLPRVIVVAYLSLQSLSADLLLHGQYKERAAELDEGSQSDSISLYLSIYDYLSLYCRLLYARTLLSWLGCTANSRVRDGAPFCACECGCPPRKRCPEAREERSRKKERKTARVFVCSREVALSLMVASGRGQSSSFLTSLSSPVCLVALDKQIAL